MSHLNNLLHRPQHPLGTARQFQDVTLNLSYRSEIQWRIPQSTHFPQELLQHQVCHVNHLHHVVRLGAHMLVHTMNMTIHLLLNVHLSRPPTTPFMLMHTRSTPETVLQQSTPLTEKLNNQDVVGMLPYHFTKDKAHVYSTCDV